MALPLAVGALTYALWPRGVAAELLARRLGAPAYAGLPRPPAWLLGHAADALWAYAMAALVTIVWRGGPARPRAAWTLTAFSVVVAAEVGQRLGWLPGTFNPTDLLVTSLAFGVAVLLLRTPIPERRPA